MCTHRRQNGPYALIKARQAATLPGMKCSRISLENIGPIEHGVINARKVNVFIGPNNSGKSIASRIMYGLEGMSDQAVLPDAERWFKLLDHVGSAADSIREAAMVARSAGIHVQDIVTHGKTNGRIEVTRNGGSVTRYSYDNAEESVMYRTFALVSRMGAGVSRDGVYIPAGRTGAMQSLLLFMQIRNDLLNTVWETLGEEPPLEIKHPLSPKPQRIGRRQRRIIPEYLERFNDLVLETASDGFSKDAQKMFTKLFHGTIESDNSYNLPQIYYRDPLGFTTKIDSAGSGVVSSFPIIASMYKVEEGGALIIEEPEAHLEPLNQQKMITGLVRAAQAKSARLVFTTHSEYVVYPLLSMVSDGELEHTELGLYHFHRTDGSYTHIKEIPVAETGEVEQELFREAIDALGTRL